MSILNVRHGVFETNSSSVHNFTACTALEYEKWSLGLVKIHRYDLEFKTLSEVNALEREWEKEDYLTIDEFWDNISNEYETFVETFEVDGVKIKVFGYSGYNG